MRVESLVYLVLFAVHSHGFVVPGAPLTLRTGVQSNTRKSFYLSLPPRVFAERERAWGANRRFRRGTRAYLPDDPAELRMALGSGSEGYKVGIVGATGAVGEELVGCLDRTGFKVSELKLFASARSAGTTKKTPMGDVVIQEFSLEAARECDFVFLAVGGDFAKEWAEKISEGSGPVVIDNSSAWRMDPDVPLVIPEINMHTCKGKKLIANPNCTTAIALMALYPLHREFGVKKCIVSTYQAASGAGAPGMNELLDETKKYVTTGEMPANKVFAHPLPLNVIPHIDVFQENLYTKEEMKVTWETRKILGEPDMAVSCTSVRIPTLRAHSEAITIETEKPISTEAARKVLSAATGVKLVDDPSANQYPMPLTATGEYDVEVGRVRSNDVFGENGLDFFVCGDQLLRGAALNAVLIAEALVVARVEDAVPA